MSRHSVSHSSPSSDSEDELNLLDSPGSDSSGGGMLSSRNMAHRGVGGLNASGDREMSSEQLSSRAQPANFTQNQKNATQGTFRSFIISALFGEFLGSFFLVFIGLAGVYTANFVGDDALGTGSLAMIAIAYGLSYGSLVYSFSMSGGGYLPSIRQLNPAVTLTLYLVGKLDALKTIVFILAQCVGGVAGCGILYLCMHSSSLHVLELYDNVNVGQQLGMSMLVSFLFCLLCSITNFAVIAPSIQSSVSADLSEQSPQTVHELNCIMSGMTCSVCTAIGTPVSGCFVNPLMGIAVYALTTQHNPAVVLIFGPLLGSALAALSARLFSYRTRSAFTPAQRLQAAGTGLSGLGLAGSSSNAGAASQMQIRALHEHKLQQHGDRF